MRKYRANLHVQLVSYRGDEHHLEKVPAIKQIREVTGLGLKEAKDLCDSLDGSGSLSNWQTKSVAIILNEQQIGRATAMQHREYEGTDFCRFWLTDVKPYDFPPCLDVSGNTMY